MKVTQQENKIKFYADQEKFYATRTAEEVPAPSEAVLGSLQAGVFFSLRVFNYFCTVPGERFFGESLCRNRSDGRAIAQRSVHWLALSRSRRCRPSWSSAT